jgi:hypothetical protein
MSNKQRADQAERMHGAIAHLVYHSAGLIIRNENWSRYCRAPAVIGRLLRNILMVGVISSLLGT